MRSDARAEHARDFLATPPAKGHAWAERHYSYDFRRDDMLFLQWYDDNPKKPTATRLAEACAAYVLRFGCTPNIILVNQADAGAVVDGCEVEAENRVRPNNYQVGRAE